MKGLVFDGTGISYREDLPVPLRAPGHSLLKIRAAAICSTDREVLRGYRPDFRGIPGHEFAAEVLESDRPGLVGKTVVGELNEGCGTCLYCRTGREKHCLNRQVIGMTRDGCFAEYMTLADHLLHPVPDGLPPETAVLTEPLAAALEIPKQVHLDPDADVAVVGDGRLAFLTAQVLALSGARLTVIGRHPEKLRKFEPFSEPVPLSAYEGPDGPVPLSAEDCFDTVVDASGSESGIRLALRLVRAMGTVVLKSTYAGSTSLDLSQIPVREITVVGSRCGPFRPALKLLSEGKISFPPVEFHPLREYREAFASEALKAGFRPELD